MKAPPLPMRPDGPLGRPFARLMERINAPAYEAVLDAISPRPGQAILEIGFGTSQFLHRAAVRMGAGSLAGVDPAPLMVTMARERLARHAATFAVDLREADAGQLDWPAQTFDAIVAIHSFQFWAAPDAVVRNLRTLLKTGGRVCICLRVHGASPPSWLPNPLSRQPDEEPALLALLAGCGFARAGRVAGETRGVLLTAEAAAPA